VVAAMVRATVAGWEQYLRDPEATNRRINQLNPEMEFDILAYGAEESKRLILDPVARKQGLGQMSLERWTGLLEQMIEADLITPGAVEPGRAFTTRFLP
jgi:NitT/TauT family transport system substrate-binding protein